MLPHPNQGWIEYLIQNVIDAGIVSSREEFAKMVKCSVGDLKGFDYIDEKFGKKLRKIIPDYNVGWWLKGNKSKDYLTDEGQKQLEVWKDELSSRLALLTRYSYDCEFFSLGEFDNEFIKPLQTIRDEFNEVYNTIAHFKRRIPNLNEKWLLTGEGDMLDNSDK